MKNRLSLSNMFKECVISHHYVDSSNVIVTLQLIYSGNYIADILYCPQTQEAKILLLKPEQANLVLECFELALSWLEAYCTALDNMQLDRFPINQMASA